jgi:acetolactate synthase I/II/III large subunit
MRLVDYIAQFIHEKLGVTKIYTLTGGGAMFLNDCVVKHPKLEAVCNHHEQACAMAAVGHAKYTNDFAVAMLTTGCGATNAITGLLDAWQDNTTCLFISGQVKRKQTSHNSNVPLRAFGIQEANIIPIVKSLTKYSVMINEPQEIAYHLEKACFLAKIGRPGPVWLDIPSDVQGATINVDNLKHFNPDEYLKEFTETADSKSIEYVAKLLESAKRPVILAGNGIRLANAVTEMKQLTNKYKIPVVASYLGADLITYDDPAYIGVIGIKGDRAANFAIQNADVILSIGCRLAVGVTGFEYDLFAREAKLIVVDIDPQEHKKNTVKIDSFINADANIFLKQLQKQQINPTCTEWQQKVLTWKNKWAIAATTYPSDSENINKYTFMQHLNKVLPSDATVVSDAGSAYYVTSQAINTRNQQRYITSGAQADMGYTLPAAIGVANATKGEIIAITGDGSLQLNIQELQTLVHFQYKIKLFVWNNNGYLSIRAAQKKFFAGRLIGADPESGISFPNLEKIAAAYDIKYFKVKQVAKLDAVMKSVLSLNEPVICEVICPENQEIIPTVSSIKKNDGTMLSKPLEDMYPFLDRKEFLDQMIIKPINED